MRTVEQFFPYTDFIAAPGARLRLFAMRNFIRSLLSIVAVVLCAIALQVPTPLPRPALAALLVLVSMTVGFLILYVAGALRIFFRWKTSGHGFTWHSNAAFYWACRTLFRAHQYQESRNPENA